MRCAPLHSAVLLSLLLVGSGVANAADRMEPTPVELEAVDVQEKLGADLPLDAAFVDENGKPVQLADYIGSKPIILTFNYSNCPMLCSVQLGGLVDAMLQMQWDLGTQYEIITISLDPNESASRAQDTKANYLERYTRKGAAEGWHFLRGSQESIERVAEAVGFGYHYFEPRAEYLHPAVLILVSPQAHVSTYIYGTLYDPIVLRDKLVGAAVGETSEALARFILSCYHYSAPKGNGAIVAKIMRYGGLVFVFGFVGALAMFGRRRAHEQATADVHQIGSSEDHV